MVPKKSVWMIMRSAFVVLSKPSLNDSVCIKKRSLSYWYSLCVFTSVVTFLKQIASVVPICAVSVGVAVLPGLG